ncbi:aspartate-semialdehyde dehydrogenase [candidate division WOR-3 bacterium]|nr:aspartate-semialdehyde dehydrogenase [candidate division WOR-3 bacterium]
MKRIGIAGATGLVGETLLRVLESGPHKIEDLRLFASARSAGAKMEFRDREYEVREVNPDGFHGLDVAFFCLEADLAKKLVPLVADHCVVIDKSSEFRLRSDVPLVVPEVNPGALKSHMNIVANPNCTTIPLVVAVNPLHREFGLREIWLASYQSVSGAGRAAVEQLQYEAEFVTLRQKPDSKGSPLGPQIADNVIPHIADFDSHGHTGEEAKTIRESTKILGLPELKVNSTCVRVPVSVGHALAVTCRFSRPVKVKDAAHVLKRAPGIVLRTGKEYATPVDCRGNDSVFVSRVRQGAGTDELSMWVVADNLRKGAATNAVQIAELLES